MDGNNGQSDVNSEAISKLEEDLQKLTHETDSNVEAGRPLESEPQMAQQPTPEVQQAVPVVTEQVPALEVEVSSPGSPESLKNGSPMLLISLGLVVVALLAAIAYVVGIKFFSGVPKQIACTTEAKVCDDGTSVGRSGPNCEFDACPIPVATATAEPTVDLQTYTSASKSYSFNIPTGLKSDTEAAGTGVESIRFTYIGPKQTVSGKTQTELSDGYSFTVTKLGLSSKLDPKTEINKQSQYSKETCTAMSAVVSVNVGGANAFQFSATCLGNYTTTYLSDGTNTYSITEVYTNDSYKINVEQILATFKFATVSASASPTVKNTSSPSVTPKGY